MQKMIELLEQYFLSLSPSPQSYNIAIAHGNAYDEAAIVKEKLVEKFKGYDAIYEGLVSPVISVHAGPGVISVGVQAI